MNRLLTALCGGLLLFASSAFAATVTVSTTDALSAALRAAAPGDVVLLADGSYPALTLFSTAQYPAFVKAGSGVTVRPAPGAHPVLAGLSLDGAQGLTFAGLDVAPGVGTGVYVVNSANIAFSGLTVHGDGASNTGNGFFVRDSSGITITGSEVTGVASGIGHYVVAGLTISNNNLHGLQTDGIFGGGSSHVVVSGNHLTDFSPNAGDHPDAIQFWAGPNSTPGADVVVSDNVITRGTGAVMQGIFVEYTNNLTVVGNAMVGTMYNGISLSGVTGGVIADNFVQGFTDICNPATGETCWTRIITRGQSANVAVHDNSAQGIGQYQDGGQPNPGYSETTNTIITPTAPGDYSAMDAWLKLNGGTVTPAPTPDPAPVPAPPPTPTPVPTVDPRDTKIADLTAQLAAETAAATASASQVTALTGQVTNLNTQVATLTKAANDNAALLSTANGKVTTLTAQVASLTAQVNASSVTTLKAQLAAANKKISNAQSALK